MTESKNSPGPGRRPEGGRAGGGPRRRGRIACMQALYRAEVLQEPPPGPEDELAPGVPPEAEEYARRLLALVAAHREEIDEVLAASLTRWDLKRLAVIDRCMLRIGAAELLFEPEVPTRVILDEAIEIAKRYGTGESGRFVNGVLDRVARDRRKEEAP